MTAVLDNDWACGAVQIRNRYKQNLRCAAGGTAILLPFNLYLYILFSLRFRTKKRRFVQYLLYTRFYRKRPPVYATSFVVD